MPREQVLEEARIFTKRYGFDVELEGVDADVLVLICPPMPDRDELTAILSEARCKFSGYWVDFTLSSKKQKRTIGKAHAYVFEIVISGVSDGRAFCFI